MEWIAAVRPNRWNRAWGTLPPLHDEFEYTGRYTNYVTAFQHHRARWFSLATGQFISKDSWGYAAGDSNLYRYARNNSTNGTDPSGHF